MSLPPTELPREIVALAGGQEVEVRGLTRGEVMRMQGLGEKVEVHLLALGTDTPLEDARAWYDQAPSRDVETIAHAVMRLSGMGKDGGGRPTETESRAS